MNESISELQGLWLKIKTELKKSVEDTRFFDVFLSESSIYSISDGIMIVAVANNLAVSVLESNYVSVIQDAAKSVLGQSVKVKFDTKENLKSKQPVTETKPTFFKNSTVNPSLTFDSFVNGPSNLEAKQAALYIASNPGKSFNPLFIYSNPGLGKTHLLHAIVNYIREVTPNKKALYCDASAFLQEYVNYVTGIRKEDDLKEYITSFDIFLLDDVQMLASKELTCKYYFDIFNDMYAHNKQIVITSDKHPSELKSFDERLKSRFGQGLTVSIYQPDVNTCVEILKSKINNGVLDINAFDPKVLEFIASRFSKNIREIDEAFNKLLWYVTSFRPAKYITMEIAMEALQSLIDIKDAKQKLDEQRIITIVADYYNLTPSQIIGPSRQGTIALARHISMYLIRKMLDTPFTKIGMIFGGKDHSTVMSGVEKVEKELKINSALETAINEIKTHLKA